MRRKFSLSGFTLLEIMISVAVVGILVAVAFPLYRNYQTKARAADIVLKYDAVRSGIGAELAQGSVEECADLSAKLNSANFRDPYARLAIGFEKGVDGYRAVFTVCAEISQQGALGVAVAREAHGVFAKTHGVEQGAVLTDSLASFAVPIATAASAVCRTASANPVLQCGVAQAPVSTVTPPTTVTQPPVTTTPTAEPGQAPRQSPTPQPVVCDPGKEKVTVPASLTGTAFEVCMPSCPAGQTRDAQLRCVAPAASQPQPVQPTPSGSTPPSATSPPSPTVTRQTTCPSGYRPNPQGHCVPDHGKGN